MAYCDAFTNNLECIIEYNNLITFKCVLFGLLLLYSIYNIYSTREGWGNTDDLFDFFKVMLQKSLSYAYIVFLPLLLLMLRPTVSFEITVILLAGFYILVSIIMFSLTLLFSYGHIKNMFGVKNKMKFMEKMKYRRGREKYE